MVPEREPLNHLFHVLVTNRLTAFLYPIPSCLWYSYILSRVLLDEPKRYDSLFECRVQHFEHIVDGVESITPLVFAVHPFLNGSTGKTF